MAQATSTQIIAAAGDHDLLRRLRAIAASEGIPSPQQWVESRMDQLAAAPATEAGDTIGSVYEYAVASYTPTPRPGEDPSKVTDEHLRHAVAHVLGPVAEPVPAEPVPVEV